MSLHQFPTNCERGIHGKRQTHPPVIKENSVNIDTVCADCGQLLFTESLQRAYWEQREAKKRSGHPSLFTETA